MHCLMLCQLICFDCCFFLQCRLDITFLFVNVKIEKNKKKQQYTSRNLMAIPFVLYAITDKFDNDFIHLCRTVLHYITPAPINTNCI